MQTDTPVPEDAAAALKDLSHQQVYGKNNGQLFRLVCFVMLVKANVSIC